MPTFHPESIDLPRQKGGDKAVERERGHPHDSRLRVIVFAVLKGDEVSEGLPMKPTAMVTSMDNRHPPWTSARRQAPQAPVGKHRLLATHPLASIR
jgi:hypothetical protein